MSVASMGQARDEICALFQNGWTLNAAAVANGIVPPINWQTLQHDTPPDPGAIHANVYVTHIDASQASLSGGLGQRRWARVGLVTIQIKVPLSLGQALSLAEQLATIARNCYEGVATTPGDVWFRNVRAVEVGRVSGNYLQFNMFAEFRYDEIH